MKNITFDITINSKKNPSKSIITNAHAYTDAIILSNLKKTAPYLFGKTSAETLEDGKTYSFEKKAPTKKSIDITISGIKKARKEPAKPDYATFAKAFMRLLNSEGYGDTYDFKLDDGTPVKMFADEIQIGYELLPLTEATKFIYDKLSDSRKKNIIDIYINI